MNELCEWRGKKGTLQYIEKAVFVGMPRLKSVSLSNPFPHVREVRMENAGTLESLKSLQLHRVVETDLSDTLTEDDKDWRKGRVRIVSKHSFDAANPFVLRMIVSDGCCNERNMSVLRLNRFVNLRELSIGQHCFAHVKEVSFIGLSMLEVIEIGSSSFAKEDRDGFSPDRRFYLKDCERLKRLKIGRYSFRDYTVCEIENDPRLEVIEMGELQEQSNNFPYTSKLELKSHFEWMK